MQVDPRSTPINTTKHQTSALKPPMSKSNSMPFEDALTINKLALNGGGGINT